MIVIGIPYFIKGDERHSSQLLFLQEFDALRCNFAIPDHHEINPASSSDIHCHGIIAIDLAKIAHRVIDPFNQPLVLCILQCIDSTLVSAIVEFLCGLDRRPYIVDLLGFLAPHSALRC